MLDASLRSSMTGSVVQSFRANVRRVVEGFARKNLFINAVDFLRSFVSLRMTMQ